MTRQVTLNELKEKFKNGKVKFQYTKKDGTIRTAMGTLKDEYITVKTSGGVNYPTQAGYTTYFDVEKNQFRCFAESKLIGVVEE